MLWNLHKFASYTYTNRDAWYAMAYIYTSMIIRLILLTSLNNLTLASKDAGSVTILHIKPLQYIQNVFPPIKHHSLYSFDEFQPKEIC